MNIAQHVERGARLFPTHTAILFEGTAWSYAAVNGQANQLANTLRAQGVQRGDRVALYLPNIPPFIICYLATLKIGAIAVSINPLFKSEELQYIVNDASASVLFTVAVLLPYVDPVACPTLRQVVVCEGDGQGKPTLADWLNQGTATGQATAMQPDEPAALLYTSGTTGFPKGATLTHGNIVSNMHAVVHHCSFRQDDRMALCLPLFHVFGQNFIMNGTFTAGGTLVLHRRFAPEPVLMSIQHDRITLFFGVPTIFMTLLNLDWANYDLSSLRYAFSAAATMPQEVARRWQDRFGRPIYEGYGLTECSPFACYNHDAHYKFGSVGTAIQHYELIILDENDNEMPRGEWGEICIKGPGVMQGYWGKPAETGQVLRNGWLHSGDIGTMDEEGYVFLMDRAKDMINAAGFKIWPAEVEQMLYHHPAIQEVAVYGIPDAVKGESVKAAVVLKEGAIVTSAELIAWCRDRMAVYKVPTAVAFLAQLPKSATGKILKRVLRSAASAGAGEAQTA